jgi:8-oxo-dGTP pyrophosphatase MutT (NUDIX family)
MMNDRLGIGLEKLAIKFGGRTGVGFLERLREGKLTREENPQTHGCVYFAAVDFGKREVLMGHHIKSGLWLCNGGHVDLGESLEEALGREMKEEWGLTVPLEKIGEPKLLTITQIEHPEKITCVRHYDVWYLVPVDKNQFTPREDLLAAEFYQTQWLSFEEARQKTTDPANLKALELMKGLVKTNEIDGQVD